MHEELLKKMYLIRELESVVTEFHKENVIRGTDHLSMGQEAIPVGLLSQISKDDIVTCAHRVHHVLIGKGLKPEKIIGELLGKTSGYNKGYAGIMHINSKEDNFWGANGIVGANIGISSGIALGLKQQKKKGIVVTFFGDGSTTQGIFHEALNMASLWNLPILFVCENNYWAQSTAIEDHSAQIKISEKVKASYNIDSIRVNGSDINEVISASKKAIEKVRKGKPFFIEFTTFRLSGHSLSDTEKIYMSKLYKKKSQENDPIKKYESFLIRKKILNQKKIEKLRYDAKMEIEKAVFSASNSKETEAHDLDGLI